MPGLSALERRPGQQPLVRGSQDNETWTKLTARSVRRQEWSLAPGPEPLFLLFENMQDTRAEARVGRIGKADPKQ